MKRKYKFCSSKYRGAWEDLKFNIKFILTLENVNAFPNIIANYIKLEEGYFEKLKEKYFWIHGKDIIYLYTEEALKNQQKAYEDPESVSNLLLKVLFYII